MSDLDFGLTLIDKLESKRRQFDAAVARGAKKKELWHIYRAQDRLFWQLLEDLPMDDLESLNPETLTALAHLERMRRQP
jgi:hypothetical protein